MSQDKLDAVRKRIDEIDVALQALIAERAEHAVTVAKFKQTDNETRDYYRPARESEVLRQVIERNQGPLSDEAIARLFREIMSACLALESPLKVAFLGPTGTYTQTAVNKHFGHSIESVPLAAIDEVFREVESGTANYGVVPIENSTEGMVTHTLDMFTRSSLQICGEVILPIHHCLLASHADMTAIKRIYSHSQSFAQCREWLDANIASAERISVASNGEAAQRAQDEADSAAVAGVTAAEIYSLKVLASNIEDEPNNTTRFLVVGKQSVPATGTDKTSLLVSTNNEAGALHNLLAPFAKHGVSMTRIESRPSRRMTWDYNFFLDMEGHADETIVAAVLKDVQEQATFFKVLGSYPKAVY